MKVTIESIDKVVTATLKACGVDDSSLSAVLDTVHYANRCGVPTHGVGRLPLYVKKIKAGNFCPVDKVEVISDSEATALLDAHNSFGQIAGKKAMDIALEKAKKYGIAIVGVRNSNNFSAAGYFGHYAAKNGMAAIVCANAAPAIAPTGGNKTIFGTNPICFAFPGIDKKDPIILDMATTVAARGKIRLAAKNGEKIPTDWAVDENGKPTDDPNEALKGSLLPIGGYKGYGLSLFIDLFAGLLMGSAFAGGVKPLSKMDSASGNGHMFIVFDVKRFMNDQEHSDRIDLFYSAVKACGEEGSVWLPGEKELTKAKVQSEIVEISAKQFEEINSIADSVNAGCRLEAVDE